MPAVPVYVRERAADEVDLYNQIHRAAYHPDTQRGAGPDREWEEMQDEAGTVSRLLGFMGERAVAAGSIAAMPFLPADSCLVTLGVLPEMQGRGIGTLMYRRLESFAASRGMTRVECTVHESGLPQLGSWLDREGFVERNRARLSRLELDTLDPSALQTAEERVRAQGLLLTTMAVEDTEDNRHRLWQLHVATHRDVPWTTPSPDMPYEKFARRFEPPYLLDCTVVVRDGDRYVGFTQARENSSGLADTSMTGVLREYRHRGIALAAKARCARCLRERGYARMQTMNHAGNAAMLAVNSKLGYVPVSELVFFNKRIVAVPQACVLAR